MCGSSNPQALIKFNRENIVFVWAFDLGSQRGAGQREGTLSARSVRPSRAKLLLLAAGGCILLQDSSLSTRC
eukprot:9492865-Pyramimonas_sp.AAC.1